MDSERAACHQARGEKEAGSLPDSTRSATATFQVTEPRRADRRILAHDGPSPGQRHASSLGPARPTTKDCVDSRGPGKGTFDHSCAAFTCRGFGLGVNNSASTMNGYSRIGTHLSNSPQTRRGSTRLRRPSYRTFAGTTFVIPGRRGTCRTERRYRC